MSAAAFEMTVPVRTGDIDEQNHVNNTVYLRWVQDVAVAHWRAIASSDAQETIDWVVLRHEIDYKAPATLGDEIVLRTWVGKATARTLWCPINTQTGRPVRIPAEVRAQFSA